jgi:hypothetical protein
MNLENDTLDANIHVHGAYVAHDTVCSVLKDCLQNSLLFYAFLVLSHFLKVLHGCRDQSACHQTSVLSSKVAYIATELQVP